MHVIYGVTFGSKHSFNDWGIYLDGNKSSKEEPEPRRLFIDVPYRNGLLDATRALSDRIFYKTRKITFAFKVAYEGVPLHDLYSRVARDVHGLSMHITEDTDPDYYWDAYNCVMSHSNSDDGIGSISIECECYPYKLKTDVTTIEATINDENVQVVCPNSRMEVTPEIVTDDQVTLSYVNEYGTTVTETLNTGTTYKFDDMIFGPGNNVLTFSMGDRNANVTITYREGEL